ncbi:unnamed protein product [marine sediment metagenome]|uniref:Uncharacterized protein n=1 Tax=marine sediment metagenome TaxID=412755 RepID=X1REG2_9ZZZZ
MKRWIKKHSKIFLIALALLLIGNSIRGIVISLPGREWEIVIHSTIIALWLSILFFGSGAADKLSNWWEKD